MDKARLTIIVQRTGMDWYDRSAGHHVLNVQGRERGVQASEIGEVLDHRLNHGITQLIWLIDRSQRRCLRAPPRFDMMIVLLENIISVMFLGREAAA
jgi:hypothetical protein